MECRDAPAERPEQIPRRPGPELHGHCRRRARLGTRGTPTRARVRGDQCHSVGADFAKTHFRIYFPVSRAVRLRLCRQSSVLVAKSSAQGNPLSRYWQRQTSPPLACVWLTPKCFHHEPQFIFLLAKCQQTPTKSPCQTITDFPVQFPDETRNFPVRGHRESSSKALLSFRYSAPFDCSRQAK
jgi:hypothetical protein